jgi:hypothetical protein
MEPTVLIPLDNGDSTGKKGRTSTKSKTLDAASASKPKTWRDIELDNEVRGIPIYATLVLNICPQGDVPV